LSVGVGLRVLAELMEEEVVELVGAKGKHDPDRVAVRHGHESGEVTLGGRRVGVERPRVRSADRSTELSLSTYRHFADRDPLTRLVLERMFAGVSTRRYRRTQERLDPEQGMLFVIDGSKALRKAIRPCSASGLRCNAVSATKNETSWSICPNATGLSEAPFASGVGVG
jgi:transposase-like protein